MKMFPYSRAALVFLCAAALLAPTQAQVLSSAQAPATPMAPSKSSSAVAASPAHPNFLAALEEQRPGKAVGRVGALSDYEPSLAGTALDSPVYFLEPSEPVPDAPSILIIGGSHGDEIAGAAAASLFVSWARPRAARLIVIPRANASAASWPDPDRPGPGTVRIAGAWGERLLRYGSRLTKPEDENLPDPERFFPFGAGPDQGLPGREARNLNRVHPGNPSGSLTSRAAHAIFVLVEKEKVGAAFDLHEAGPSSGLAWNIIAHPKNLAFAAMGILAADERGVRMVLDQSREVHRGLSHREWGQGTKASAYLIETLNPGQVTGGKPGLDHLGNPLSPLWKRVGIQVETVLAILSAHSDMDEIPGWALVEGMPGLAELEKDLARFF